VLVEPALEGTTHRRAVIDRHPVANGRIGAIDPELQDRTLGRSAPPNVDDLEAQVLDPVLDFAFDGRSSLHLPTLLHD
jgi:hypothetical protein